MGIDSLRDLRLRIGGQKVSLLAADGQFDCMFDFLERRTEVEHDVALWAQTVPAVARTGDPLADVLAARKELPLWCDIPRVLLRLAQLGFASGLDMPDVLGAINTASEFADELSLRSQLFVVAHNWRPE